MTTNRNMAANASLGLIAQTTMLASNSENREYLAQMLSPNPAGDQWEAGSPVTSQKKAKFPKERK